MSSEEDRNRTTRHDWVILGLLALSLTANVALGIGFLRLASVSPPPSQRAAGTSDIPAIGTRVPPIVAQRLGGGRETIAYGPSEQPTLLYVFTPACECHILTVVAAAPTITYFTRTHRKKAESWPYPRGARRMPARGSVAAISKPGSPCRSSIARSATSRSCRTGCARIAVSTRVAKWWPSKRRSDTLVHRGAEII